MWVCYKYASSFFISFRSFFNVAISSSYLLITAFVFLITVSLSAKAISLLLIIVSFSLIIAFFNQVTVSSHQSCTSWYSGQASARLPKTFQAPPLGSGSSRQSPGRYLQARDTRKRVLRPHPELRWQTGRAILSVRFLL